MRDRKKRQGKKRETVRERKKIQGKKRGTERERDKREIERKEG